MSEAEDKAGSAVVGGARGGRGDAGRMVHQLDSETLRRCAEEERILNERIAYIHGRLDELEVWMQLLGEDS